MKNQTKAYLRRRDKRVAVVDYQKMIEDVLSLVENDFVFNMELKTMPKSKRFTQKEAMEMATLLSRIYSISHCIHCEPCQIKYIK